VTQDTCNIIRLFIVSLVPYTAAEENFCVACAYLIYLNILNMGRFNFRLLSDMIICANMKISADIIIYMLISTNIIISAHIIFKKSVVLINIIRL